VSDRDRRYHQAVAGEPSNPTPNPASPQPPPPPVPGASRDEWRAWRRANRDYMHAQWRGGGPAYGPWSGGWGWWGGWGLFWGVALVLVGAYSLLSNLGLLNWLRGDILWPSLIILLGVILLVRRGRGGWW